MNQVAGGANVLGENGMGIEVFKYSTFTVNQWLLCQENILLIIYAL